MSVQVEKMEKNMAKLTIEASAEDFRIAIRGAYQKQRPGINVHGFRKGKVPQVIVEKMYGVGVFYEDAANALIPEHYSKAAAESELNIVSQPEIDIVQIEKGKPFIFTAEVALKPEVILGEYKGVEVPKADTEVTDEEITAELKKEQDKNARVITVEDRAAQDGDTVIIDFDGFVDGVPFEGGTGRDYSLTLGSGSFIPGFEEQLIGRHLEENVEVNVTFPEDYSSEELQGKAAVFQCKIHKIEAKELPGLDDEFAQDVSEFDTLEEYKADVKRNLEKKKAEEAKRAKEDAVVDKVIESAKMEIPDAMLASRVKQMVDDFTRRIELQGLTMDQYMQFTGSTLEDVREQMKPQALKRIQSRLVLEKVAEVEQIEASGDRLNEEIKNLAGTYEMEADKFKDIISDDEKEQMKKDLAVQEAVTFLTEHAIEK